MRKHYMRAESGFTEREISNETEQKAGSQGEGSR